MQTFIKRNGQAGIDPDAETGATQGDSPYNADSGYVRQRPEVMEYT